MESIIFQDSPLAEYLEGVETPTMIPTPISRCTLTLTLHRRRWRPAGLELNRDGQGTHISADTVFRTARPVSGQFEV